MCVHLPSSERNPRHDHPLTLLLLPGRGPVHPVDLGQPQVREHRRHGVHGAVMADKLDRLPTLPEVLARLPAAGAGLEGEEQVPAGSKDAHQLGQRGGQVIVTDVDE